MGRKRNSSQKGRIKLESERRQEPKSQVPQLPRNYWEDPVYHFVMALRKQAQKMKRMEEDARLGNLAQQIVNRAIDPQEYVHLMEQYRVFRQEQRKEKKKQQPRIVVIPSKEMVPTQDIYALKRRIFNVHTSTDNMIKAIEALPKEERRRTVKKLTPFLRSRIEVYLREHGYLQ